MQAPISLDGIVATWGYLDMGREQKAGQRAGSNTNIPLHLWGTSRNESLSNILMWR